MAHPQYPSPPIIMTFLGLEGDEGGDSLGPEFAWSSISRLIGVAVARNVRWRTVRVLRHGIEADLGRNVEEQALLGLKISVLL